MVFVGSQDTSLLPLIVICPEKINKYAISNSALSVSRFITATTFSAVGSKSIGRSSSPPLVIGDAGLLRVGKGLDCPTCALAPLYAGRFKRVSASLASPLSNRSHLAASVGTLSSLRETICGCNRASQATLQLLDHFLRSSFLRSIS